MKYRKITTNELKIGMIVLDNEPSRPTIAKLKLVKIDKSLNFKRISGHNFYGKENGFIKFELPYDDAFWWIEDEAGESIMPMHMRTGTEIRERIKELEKHWLLLYNQESETRTDVMYRMRMGAEITALKWVLNEKG